MGVHNKEIYQGRLEWTEAEMKKFQSEGVI